MISENYETPKISDNGNYKCLGKQDFSSSIFKFYVMIEKKTLYYHAGFSTYVDVIY